MSAINLSFAGCGFLGIYHAGVASCLREYAPNILVNKISGASAGALSAACLICDCSMGQITSDILKIATTARKYTLGPFSPKFQIVKILRDRLNQILPENAHILCSDRLHISVTRVSDGKNEILSQFNTKEELIQALLCSSFIPIFSGIIPEKFRGVRYIDGCYSNNLPILDENTVTVSPFCGESDICPRDNSYNLFQVNLANTSIELSPQNLYRFMRILFPPHPEILSEMCRQGFDDALRFLQKNNLISCTRCIAINSTLEIQEMNEETELEDSEDEDEMCEECKRRREIAATVDDLPEAVLNVLEESILSMNSGIMGWMFKHKTMRVLSIFTIPYILPFDIMQAAFLKFKDLVPKLGEDLNTLVAWAIAYIKAFLFKFSKETQLYSAKFTCQLAITEYDFNDVPPVKPFLRSAPGSRRASAYNIRRPPRPRSGDWNVCPHKEKQHSNASSRRGSCFDFGFSVDLASIPHSTSKPLVKAIYADKKEQRVVDLANAALNWDPTVIEHSNVHLNEHVLNDQMADTFDQVLEVTKQHDAVMAYYYLDDDNLMKVTEIFDATDPDTGAILSPEEHELNRRLEWDEIDSSLNLSPDIYSLDTEDLYEKLCDYDSDLDVKQNRDFSVNPNYLSITDNTLGTV